VATADATSVPDPHDDSADAMPLPGVVDTPVGEIAAVMATVLDALLEL
jgi:hypothetical protein